MMKPDLETLEAFCPGIDAAFVQGHLDRLEAPYFEWFPAKTVLRHIQALAGLTADEPVEVLINELENGRVACTILAFDYPAVFSLITGVLSSMGLSVSSGDIFTYREAKEPTPPPQPRRGRVRLQRKDDPLRRRRIIDRFEGTITSDLPLPAWRKEIKRRLSEVLRLLEQGDEKSVDRAKQTVNQWVTDWLSDQGVSELPVLYPVKVDIDNSGEHCTRVTVTSQDTPAFLYALTTALALNGLYLERLRIRTHGGRVRDEIDLVHASGEKVTDEIMLDQLKFSVLLTRQFTYFLSRAPDPFAALSRFEKLLEDQLRLPDRERWIDMLSNPRSMENLARVLGASDFLWEDFIRLQYESLMPILQPYVRSRRLSEAPEVLGRRLDQALEQAQDFDEKVRRLNEFKDREIFLIDLDHLLTPGSDFHNLAQRLTLLAEQVVRAAVAITCDELTRLHGVPRTVAGLETAYAVFGLGKLGGAAIGYASDIELLFVYSDSGYTDGEDRMTNAQFFDELVKRTAQVIRSKREGIFEVDLRLRPHGVSGPRAASLQSFVSYYGKTDEAHSYERLALVRMRAVAGDPELGARVERLRDEYVYATHSVDPEEIHDLRAKQWKEKRKAGRYNAKFSRGALVDVEYTVQMLQVQHGGEHPALRTPRIVAALDLLAGEGLISPDEAERLTRAYDFLRELINALRMLRGSAQDLYLPPAGTDEYIHLARRMGYQRRGNLDAGRQLFVDFETHTAAVRTFVERHFGPKSLPGSRTGNVADLLLSEEPTPQLIEAVLSTRGFADPNRAYRNLKGLAGRGWQREVFIQIAVLATDVLRHEPDPDMALNNWERFVSGLDAPAAHFEEFMSQPRRLQVLLSVFSRSQFLANTLIRYPEFLNWATSPATLQYTREREDMEKDLRAWVRDAGPGDAWLDALRRFRRRELLRIGTLDMCLGAELETITRDLSSLAATVLQVALERCRADLLAEGRMAKTEPEAGKGFCMLAFGKLGGEELNYSSDLDLLGVVEAPTPSEPDAVGDGARLLEAVRSALTRHTAEGYTYRLDFRLRPYGSSGEFIHTLDSLEGYYHDEASPWEIQALLKLRPVAGDLETGRRMVERLRPFLLQARSATELGASIDDMRKRSMQQAGRGLVSGLNIKSGEGGIRDIEFLVQGLQLLHAPEHPCLLGGHTLRALEALNGAGILPRHTADDLRGDYVMLRRIEHCLQILEDQQIHSLPTDTDALAALARRVAGPQAAPEVFLRDLQARMQRVHAAYLHYLPGADDRH